MQLSSERGVSHPPANLVDRSCQAQTLQDLCRGCLGPFALPRRLRLAGEPKGPSSAGSFWSFATTRPLSPFRAGCQLRRIRLHRGGAGESGTPGSRR